MTHVHIGIVVLVAVLTGCSRGSDPQTADDVHRCPPCPARMYCASDVMIKDLKTGTVVCHPTYCLPGPDPLCEIDPEACAER
ncbi:MAG: hypothetical protein R3B13_16520 [Polyangiaceae bacterium]